MHRLVALAFVVCALWSVPRSAGAEPQPLDVHASHPNGLQIEVTGIDRQPMQTILSVRIANGFRNPVKLQNAQQGTYLEAQPGGARYFIATSPADWQLRIDGQTALEGDLAFIGRVRDDAEELKLVINAEGDAEDTNTGEPRLEIALPLQPAGPAATEGAATGSDPAADAAGQKKSP
ncbi:MAG: hypothetical protein KDE35_06145 [Geminicoccaceae bacterium]|nr:hypothetical protein [Geminicoccaceae bacterium]